MRNSRPRPILGLLLFFSVGQLASAGQIVVQGDCRLVDAIIAANTDSPQGGCAAGSGADELVLTEDVLLTSRASEGHGLPTITTEITISGNGFTVARDEDAASFRIVQVSPTGALVVRETTIANGLTVGVEPGAGIENVGGSVVVEDSALIGNVATDTAGGGLHNDDGVVFLRDSTVSGNFAGFGISGGLSNQHGVMSILRTAISDNYGGVRNTLQGSLSIVDSTIADNEFGGIINYIGTLHVLNSTLSGNGFPNFTTGGINNAGGVVSVRNSTISGNVNGVVSGDSYRDTATYLVNTTVTGNLQFGIDAACPCYPDGVKLSLRNSIVTNNGDDDCKGGGDYFNLGGNFDSDGSCLGATTMTGLDPQLADHGGPTKTHALIAESNAIDAAGSCGLEEDQRGFGRIDESCDSGAYEFDAFPVGPTLEVSGSCPGSQSLNISGASLAGPVALVHGLQAGAGVIPGDDCTGTEIGLKDASLVRVLVVDPQGEQEVAFESGPLLCVQLLQAVDLITCGVGNVVALGD